MVHRVLGKAKQKSRSNRVLALAIVLLAVTAFILYSVLEKNPAIGGGLGEHPFTGFVIYGSGVTNVSACGTLDAANSYYALNQSVSSAGTCFNVTAANVTLDCAGYGISFSSASAGYGVFSGVLNTTVKNCAFINQVGSSSSSYGVYFGAGNGTIYNNAVTIRGASGYGVWLQNSNYSNVTNNTIVSVGAGAYGLKFSASCFNRVTNNVVSTTAANANGLDFGVASNNNVFIGDTITTINNGSVGVEFGSSSYDNAFFDSVINASFAGVNDVHVRINGDNFTNCTFSKVTIDNPWSRITNTGRINVFWYVDVHTINSDGSDLAGVNVSESNVSGNLIYGGITNGTGWLPRQTIQGYMRNATAVYNMTPHWFNASKNIYYSNNTRIALTKSYAGGNALNLILVFGAPVFLNYPLNNSFLNSHDVSFVYTPILNNSIKNATLWSNFDGSWKANNSNATPILNNSENTIEVNGIKNGVFLWNVRVCDVGGSCFFAAKNSTLTIDDSAPALSLSSPVDGSEVIVKGDTVVSFQWNVTDNLASYLNCNVFVKNVFQATVRCRNSVLCIQNISGFLNGSYTWRVNCSDGLNPVVSGARNFFVLPKAWFVSVDGSSSGDGSIGNPWDLVTALKDNSDRRNANFVVKPGDTIYLRAGTYRGQGTDREFFSSDLRGSSGNLVTVMPYNNEKAIIDGTVRVNNDYVMFRDFEVIRDYAYYANNLRVSTHPDSSGSDIPHSGGFTVYGRGIKIVNNIIHDTTNGNYVRAPNPEFYGNIIYNNGWDAPNRGHGHGTYIQNYFDDTDFILNNIYFNNLGGYGVHAYGEGDPAEPGQWVNNIYIENNTVFKNTFLVGSHVITNLTVIGNLIGANSEMRLGYYREDHNNAIVKNNVIYGTLTIESWVNLTSDNNSVIGTTNVYLNHGNNLSDLVVNNNSYFLNSPSLYYHNSTRLTNNFTVWRNLGYDANGTYNSSSKTGIDVYLKDNKYDSNRTDIIVYSWSHSNFVDVDLGGRVGVGDSYEVRDVQNYSVVVLSGTFGGGALQLPLNLTGIAKYEGNFTGEYHNHTAKEVHTSHSFNVFVLRVTSRAEGGGEMDGERGGGGGPTAFQGANPVDGFNSSSSSVTFDLKCSSNVSISTIQLWGDWSGTWRANYSNSSYANNTWLNVTVAGIPNGRNYVWGVWCNDSAGNSNSTGNRSFSVSKTYFVSPSGNDSNNGSREYPFKTPQRAAGIVNPGDTVIIRDGSYTDEDSNDVILDIRRSGTSVNYITFKAENKWGAVLDGQDKTKFCIILRDSSANYTLIEDLEIKNCTGYGVKVWASHDIIRQNKIHHIGRRITNDSIGVGIHLTSLSPYTIVDRNLIYSIGKMNPYTDPPAPEEKCGGHSSCYNHDHGIYAEGSYFNITNNIFYDHKSGWDIQICEGTQEHIIVEGNTFADPNPQRAGQVIICAPSHDILIKGNIFYNPTTAMIRLTYGNDITDLVIKNNRGTVGRLVYDDNQVNYTSSDNYLNTDPLFVNATNRDYRLQSRSPAIDNISQSVLSRDFDGVLRPQWFAFDVGAYEYNGIPTPSPFPSPSPSASPSPSVSPSPSASPSPSTSPSPSPSPSSGPEASSSPSLLPSVSPSPESSPSASPSVEASPSASPSVSPEASVSPSPESSPSPEASLSPSPETPQSPSPEASLEPSVEASVEPSVEPSVEASPYPIPSVNPLIFGFVLPTPENGEFLNQGYVFVNVESDASVSLALLRWSTPSRVHWVFLSKLEGIWERNVTGLDSGVHCFKAYGFLLQRRALVTEERCVTLQAPQSPAPSGNTIIDELGNWLGELANYVIRLITG